MSNETIIGALVDSGCMVPLLIFGMFFFFVSALLKDVGLGGMFGKG